MLAGLPTTTCSAVSEAIGAADRSRASAAASPPAPVAPGATQPAAVAAHTRRAAGTGPMWPAELPPGAPLATTSDVSVAPFPISPPGSGHGGGYPPSHPWGLLGTHPSRTCRPGCPGMRHISTRLSSDAAG